MKAFSWSVLGVLAIGSLILFAIGFGAFGINLLGDDWGLYWTWHGNLFSFDSYEDITNAKGDVVANSITMRRFSPWPSKVQLRFVKDAVEIGTEVPYPRGIDAKHVWVDSNNQPVDNRDTTGHYYGPVETTAIFQIPEHFYNVWLLFLAITGALPVVCIVCAGRALLHWTAKPRRAEGAATV